MGGRDQNLNLSCATPGEQGSDFEYPHSHQEALPFIETLYLTLGLFFSKNVSSGLLDEKKVYGLGEVGGSPLMLIG